jgi:hypothetical protein
MTDLRQLQILAQLVDEMEISINQLEADYKNNNAENFNKSKNQILEIQNKISKMLK